MPNKSWKMRGELWECFELHNINFCPEGIMSNASSAPIVRNPHPWYGECDAMGPRGECWECFTMKATDAELAAVADTLSAEAEYAREAIFRRRAV